MYTKIYIALFYTFVTADFAVCSNEDAPKQCALVRSKPAFQCIGLISECWSPGQLDVDCANGAGLCCFDGCVNSCLKPDGPTCTTVVETKFENVTHEMCNPVEQPPICTTHTEQDCTNTCHMVDETVPTPVETTSCSPVTEPVCHDVTSQVCNFPDNPENKCPLIHAKPVDQCVNETKSDCWSPGVPDVDCAGWGLCCFNGCYNKCLKKCHTVETNQCNPVQSEECTDVPTTECNDFPMPVQVPITTTTCIKREKVCTTMLTKVCKDFVDVVCKEVDSLECKTVQIPKDQQITELVCEDKVVQDCVTSQVEVCNGSKINSYIPFECQMVPIVNCQDKPLKECRNDTRVVTVLIDTQQCENVPKNVCTNVTTNECRNIDVEKCTEGIDETCSTVLTEISEEIVFNKCQMVVKKDCKKVLKEECKIVTEEVCPECEKMTVTTKQCTNVQKESCQKILTTVDKIVPREVCTNICTPREETTCTPSEPKVVCNPVIKTVSYQVPVQKCE